MGEREIWNLMENINKEIDDSLFNVITKYLVKDDKYCEELYTCLTRVKDKEGNILPHILPIKDGKRFVELSIEDKISWFKFNYYNTGRGYMIRTFTYHWLHKLWLKGKYGFTDAGWRNSLDLYFNDGI